ncbi:unnamed protein product, partial [Cuscuta epithymum]
MAATTNGMEANKKYGGDNELGLGWTWEDIFGPSRANTPAAMEGCELATGGGMQDHEDTWKELNTLRLPRKAMKGRRMGKLWRLSKEDEEENVIVVVPEVGMKFDSTDT